VQYVNQMMWYLLTREANKTKVNELKSKVPKIIVQANKKFKKLITVPVNHALCNNRTPFFHLGKALQIQHQAPDTPVVQYKPMKPHE